MQKLYGTRRTNVCVSSPNLLRIPLGMMERDLLNTDIFGENALNGYRAD